jgi:probable phosphoglycerate mutase
VTRLVLVRHGEAQAYLDNVVAGTRGCKGLSDLGRRQAAALHDRLARTGELGEVDALYASTLPRAVETAEIIAPAVGALPVRQECELCEQHPGEGDGLTWSEFEERYRPDGWRFDPYAPFAPGAESTAEFQARVARALTGLAREHEGGTVVVACHGGVVDGSMVAFLGLGHHGGMVELRTENTSLTEWLLQPGEQVADRPARWRLVRYNDAAHLAGVD